MTINISRKIARKVAFGRRNRRRVVRRNPKTAYVAKTVARQVVAKALNAKLETHCRDITLSRIVMDPAGTYALNPLYYIPLATTEADRIGDRISNVKLHLRGTYFHVGVNNGAGGYIATSTKLRVMVIRTSVAKWRQASETQWSLISAGTPAGAMTNDDIWKGGADTGNMHLLFPNMNKVNVLFDKVYNSEHIDTPSSVSASYVLGHGTSVNISVPLGKYIQFETNTTGSYTKNHQYYIVLSSSGLYGASGTPLPNSGTTSGIFDGKMMLTWKDA